MFNASSEIKISTALDYASGTASRNGAILDMKGFEGVMIVAKMATIAQGAVTTIKAQQGAAANMSDAADLLGTSISIADDDDDQIFILDLVKPRERYVRVVVGKDGANAVAESVTYVQYGAREKPVVQTVADEVTYERHISPAEGTA